MTALRPLQVWLACLCALPLLAPSAPAQERAPEETVRALITALRQGDLPAVARDFLGERELAQAEASWKLMLSLAPRVVREVLDLVLDELSHPEVLDELWSELEPELEELQREWREMNRWVSDILTRVALHEPMPAEQRDELLRRNAVLRDCALSLDLADAAKARRALEIALNALHALKFQSFEELRGLSFDALIADAAGLFRAVDGILALHGIGLDATLEALEVRTRSQEEDRATVEVSGELLGWLLELVREGSSWRLVSLKSDRAALDVSVLAHLVPAMDTVRALRLPLDLPRSSTAPPLEWTADPIRPVVVVRASGAIVAGGTISLPGAGVEELGELRSWLWDRARQMQRMPLGSGDLPASPLLIRAEAGAPFERVLTLQALSCHNDIKLWDIRLAVQRADGRAGMLSLAIPSYEVLTEADPVAVELRALPGGELECRVGERRTRESADLGPWLAEALGSPGHDLSIQVDPQVTCAQIVSFIDACREAEVAEIFFEFP